VRILYVLSSRCGLALSHFERNKVNVTPNYNLLHWRTPHVNGVVFAELDSYDIRGMSAMIYRSVPHHRIRYIHGATGERRRRLCRSPMRELDSMDYVFIDSDETVRAWLISNPVLDDPLDLMMYCYRDRGSGRQDTPVLRGVAYLNENDVRNWALDPAQRIGQMHSRQLFDESPADRQGSDTDDTRENDTSHLSESSSGLSDSAHGSEILFTILPRRPVGHAKCPANRIPLLAKSLSEQNRQLLLNVLHRTAQGEDDPMHSIQFDGHYRMEDTPEKCRLNYLIKEYRRSEETRKPCAGFDAESTEDPKSKRVRTGAGQENLTGELMDSMALRLSAMSTLMSRGLVVWTVISKGH